MEHPRKARRIQLNPKQVAQLWQRDRVSSATLRGWITLRLNFRLKGYISRHVIIIVSIIIFYFHLKNQTMYSAITYRVIEMVGCQKSKCSSSSPPITTFTCVLDIQTFILRFTFTFTFTYQQFSIQTSKRPK